MKEYVVLYIRACEEQSMVSFGALWRLILWFLRNIRHCKTITIFVYPKVSKGESYGSD